MSTQPISSINEEIKKHEWPDIKERAKAIHSNFITQGFLRTNFGWLKKEWIEQGFFLGAIKLDKVSEETHLDNNSKYYQYHLVSDTVMINKSVRRGRTTHENEEEKIDTTKIKAFFDYIKYQWELLAVVKNKQISLDIS